MELDFSPEVDGHGSAEKLSSSACLSLPPKNENEHDWEGGENRSGR